MSLDYYRGMLVQRRRMEGFDAAIRARVAELRGRTDSPTVLEVGSGLGTYSMFAARAGAGRVWAVEGGPIAPVSRQVIRDNGFEDRIVVLEGWYPEVAPPERVHLAIYEDYGPRLLDARTWGLLRHIAERALLPGGRLLPDRARLWIAPVHSPRCAEISMRLGGTEDVCYGLDWEASRPCAPNTPLPAQLRRDELVGERKLLADVRLLPPPSAAEMSGSGTWTFNDRTEVHGLAFWFELEVGEGVWLTNEPGGQPGSWGHLYLPSDRPVVLEAGASLRGGVGFDAGRAGEPTWLRWDLEGGGIHWSGHEFASVLTTGDRLWATSQDWVPALEPSGRWTRRVLELADGLHTVGDMVANLMDEGYAETRPEAEQMVARALSGRAK